MSEILDFDEPQVELEDLPRQGRSIFRPVRQKVELRPFMIGMTRDQYESLVALARSMGVELPKVGPAGQNALVSALVRNIANGKIVIAWASEVDGVRV